jgi:DNA mismatch endonuclease, patch repair protein
MNKPAYLPPSALTSRTMSAIRSRGNRSTEQRFARLLRAARITGWRRHVKLAGTPDFAFSREKVVVFVDGCFWHSCPLHCQLPKRNPLYWEAKLRRNRARDRRISRTLRSEGWSVIRIWEHQVRTRECICISRLQRLLAIGASDHRSARFFKRHSG